VSSIENKERCEHRGWVEAPLRHKGTIVFPQQDCHISTMEMHYVLVT
jgi:hypothetical protein